MYIVSIFFVFFHGYYDIIPYICNFNRCLIITTYVSTNNQLNIKQLKRYLDEKKNYIPIGSIAANERPNMGANRCA